MDAAYDLNRPLRLTHAAARLPFVTSSARNFIVETIKPAEDGTAIIVRGFEAHRQRGPVRLSFSQTFARISTCSLLEGEERRLAKDSSSVTLDVAPFEIVSLRLER